MSWTHSLSVGELVDISETLQNGTGLVGGDALAVAAFLQESGEADVAVFHLMISLLRSSDEEESLGMRRCDLGRGFVGGLRADRWKLLATVDQLYTSIEPGLLQWFRDSNVIAMVAKRGNWQLFNNSLNHHSRSMSLMGSGHQTSTVSPQVFDQLVASLAATGELDMFMELVSNPNENTRSKNRQFVVELLLSHAARNEIDFRYILDAFKISAEEVPFMNIPQWTDDHLKEVDSRFPYWHETVGGLVFGEEAQVGEIAHKAASRAVSEPSGQLLESMRRLHPQELKRWVYAAGLSLETVQPHAFDEVFADRIPLAIQCCGLRGDAERLAYHLDRAGEHHVPDATVLPSNVRCLEVVKATNVTVSGSVDGLTDTELFIWRAGVIGDVGVLERLRQDGVAEWGSSKHGLFFRKVDGTAMNHVAHSLDLFKWAIVHCNADWSQELLLCARDLLDVHVTQHNHPEDVFDAVRAAMAAGFTSWNQETSSSATVVTKLLEYDNIPALQFLCERGQLQRSAMAMLNGRYCKVDAFLGEVERNGFAA